MFIPVNVLENQKVHMGVPAPEAPQGGLNVLSQYWTPYTIGLHAFQRMVQNMPSGVRLPKFKFYLSSY